jgi:hypothetical protein
VNRQGPLICGAGMPGLTVGALLERHGRRIYWRAPDGIHLTRPPPEVDRGRSNAQHMAAHTFADEDLQRRLEARYYMVSAPGRMVGLYPMAL